MNPSPASSITKAASKQTYYTIRLLVDRAHADNAYRAYAYFRWVDDVLDADSGSGPVLSEVEASERRAFLERQKSLLEKCIRGESLHHTNIQEKMLVELVMDFDVRRRGRLNSRHRLAGFAYMARFEWLLETIEREGFILRPQYNERKSIGTGLRMSWLALSSMISLRAVGTPSRQIASQRQGKV